MTSRRPRQPASEWGFRAVCALILLFLMLPTLLIVPMSFSPTSFLRFPPQGISLRWYREYLLDAGWIDATLFSVQIAALTMLASTVVGTMGSLALVRGRLPGRQTLEALLLAPLIVPHIIVAIATYLQFAPLGLTGTRLGFVLIHTALAVLNLGASRLTCFRRITLPLILPAVLAGAVFAFLASFDETVVSFFISGTEHKTVTRKMFEDIEFNLSPVIAAASTIFVAATLALMVLANATKGRGEGAA